MIRALYGPERRARFRTHYFPFTEPSMEPDISCAICGGGGCRVCKDSGWIEMGGSGMVDPAVFEKSATTPRNGRALRSGWGWSEARSFATRSPVCVRSGRATSAS